MEHQICEKTKQGRRVRYIFLITLFFIMLMSVQTSASMPIGTKIGEVLSTDIIATIDHRPIPSMNINGYTAIVVEDLRSYGFNVAWSEENKTLQVTRNNALLVQGKVFTTEPMEPGHPLDPVLFTDIKTYLDGREVVSFNIDGRTAIYLNQLKPYGEIQWNESTRVASFQFPEPVVEPESQPASEEVQVSRRSTQLDPEQSYLHAKPLDRSDIPEHIRVGLLFGNSAVSNIQLTSSDGFIIGEFDKDAFQGMIQIKDSQRITLKADNDGYIGLKKPYTSIVQAQEFKQGLMDEGLPAFLSWELSGWNVYAGPVMSSKDAQDLQDRWNLNPGDWTFVQSSPDRIRVETSNGMTLLVYSGSNPPYFSSLTTDIRQSVLQAGQSKYRGTITAIRTDYQPLTIVNKLSIEQYLYGVVPREMPHTWHIEALKAQAVAARGFAMANIGKNETQGFDVCNTTYSQVYGGYAAEQSNTNQAVDQTHGKVMTAAGKLVIPYYHSSSGGRTESSEYVWNAAVSYARGIDDPYSLDAPHARWDAVFTLNEVEQMLQQRGIHVGSVTDLRIMEFSPNGRVQELVIYGTNGSQSLYKQDTRSFFGLRSNYFDLTIQDNSVMIEGRGYGHGVGMSQHGARGMADNGYSWQQILAHYYTGVRIE